MRAIPAPRRGRGRREAELLPEARACPRRTVPEKTGERAERTQTTTKYSRRNAARSSMMQADMCRAVAGRDARRGGSCCPDMLPEALPGQELFCLPRRKKRQAGNNSAAGERLFRAGTRRAKYSRRTAAKGSRRGRGRRQKNSRRRRRETRQAGNGGPTSCESVGEGYRTWRGTHPQAYQFLPVSPPHFIGPRPAAFPARSPRLPSAVLRPALLCRLLLFSSPGLLKSAPPPVRLLTSCSGRNSVPAVFRAGQYIWP